MRCNNAIKFIAQSKIIHDDKYDYSLVEYINTKVRVKIICPYHGIFTQTPTQHLEGKGCFPCGHISSANNRRCSKEDFVKKAEQIHGNNLYDYTNVRYINNSTKVTIGCKQHGLFEMTPDNHTSQKQGCPMCGKIKKAISKTKPKEWFIERAQKIHGLQKYDYSKIKYVNVSTPIQIICSRHGLFTQIPLWHLNSRGCPECAKDSRHGHKKERYVNYCLVKNKRTYLYVVLITGHDEKFVKIGLTSALLAERFKPTYGYHYEELKSVFGPPGWVWDTEHQLHQHFKPLRYKPSVRIKGSTECYRIDALDQILNRVNEYARCHDTTPKP